ncbi:hypothetical protein E2562_025512 [Oryza meyeriana var. granulata]|uniref:Uncharacterized protein n=1 Tax=Oryza meyeriana var. granulata TaxID=110450 RepID=A0A6G1C7C2_9ORYZ|nr:hypothetical protein E2562_025512 [Oryza meyeriana var. granulata]
MERGAALELAELLELTILERDVRKWSDLDAMTTSSNMKVTSFALGVSFGQVEVYVVVLLCGDHVEYGSLVGMALICPQHMLATILVLHDLEDASQVDSSGLAAHEALVTCLHHVEQELQITRQRTYCCCSQMIHHRQVETRLPGALLVRGVGVAVKGDSCPRQNDVLHECHF